MKLKLGVKVPSCIPERLRDEYLRWIRNSSKYETQYPVTARILKKLIEDERNEKVSGKSEK